MNGEKSASADEQGLEDIYPDPLAREFGEAYAVNPKSLEGRMAAATAARD